MCLMAAPAAERKMHQLIVRSLEKLVAEATVATFGEGAKAKKRAVPRTVCAKDLVLHVRAVAGRLSPSLYLRCSDALSAHGNVKARQMFSLLESSDSAASSSSDVGALPRSLSLVRMQHEKPYEGEKVLGYLREALVGRLSFLDHEQVAAKFQSATVVEVDVLTSTLALSDSALDTFLVKGVASTLRVSVDDDLPAPAVADVPVAPVADASVDGEDDDDIGAGLAAPDFSALFGVTLDAAGDSGDAGAATAAATTVGELLEDATKELALIFADDEDVAGMEEVDSLLNVFEDSFGECGAGSGDSLEPPALEPRALAGTAYDLESVCRDLRLVNLSSGKTFSFADAEAPTTPCVAVLLMGDKGVKMAAKVRCHRHRGCNFFIPPALWGREQWCVLKAVLEWSVAGKTCSQPDHVEMAQQLRSRWGVHVKR